MIRHITTLIASVVVCTFSVTHAAPVAVPNGSFEAPAVTSGNFSVSIDDWDEGNEAATNDGVFIGGEFGQAATATDGSQVAFLNADTGEIYQTLGGIYMAGAEYTLTVDVSGRTAPGTDSMRLVLFEGTITGLGDLNAGNTVGSVDIGAGDGVAGDVFNEFSLTVTAADITAAGAAGQNIGIGFFGLNSGSGTSDFDLDNVRLEKTVEAIPTPAALPAGLAMVGVVATRRRRR